MNVDKREQKIISLLETNKEVSIEELSKILDCSASTVRKQLTSMSDKGLLIRVHGGARAIDIAVNESFESKMNKSAVNKREIAKKARGLITPGASVALGSGSTVYNLALLLPEFKLNAVYTNSIPAVDFLSQHSSHEVHISGGIVRKYSGTIVGTEESDYFNNLKCVDYAFIGCDGITGQGEICVDNLSVAQADRGLLMSAKKKYILCDTEKLGKEYVAKIGNLTECDGLVISGAYNVLIDKLEEFTKVII